MGLLFNRCVTCQGLVSKRARFCSICGAGSASATRACPTCQAVVGADRSHCWSCGIDFKHVGRPVLANGTWVRREGEVAIVVAASALPGFTSKSIDIQHNTRGLLLSASGPPRPLPTGVHTLGRGDRVFLYADGDLPLRVRFPGLTTRDRLDLDGTAHVRIRITEPMKLFNNVVKERSLLGAGVLANELAWGLAQAMSELVAQSSPALPPDRIQLQTSARALLTGSPAAAMLGIQIIEAVKFDIHSEDYARLDDREREVATKERAVADKEIDLDLKTKFRELYTRELRSDQDFANFRAELEQDADIQHLLRGRAKTDIERYYRDQDIDRDLSRKHTLRRLELEHEHELRRKHAIGEADLSRDLLDKRLEREQLEFAAQRSREFQRRLEEMRMASAQRQLERDDDLEDATLGLNILDMMKRKKMERQLEEQTRVQQLRLDSEIARLEVEERRLRVLSELDAAKRSQEADIAREQRQDDHATVHARLQVQLEEARIRAGMSPEQLQFVMAERSPALADALKARWTADSVNADQPKLVEAMRSFLDELSRSAEKDKDRWASVAHAQAQSRGGAPPSGWSPAPVSPLAAPATGPVLRCTYCNSDNPTTANHCMNCGATVRAGT